MYEYLVNKRKEEKALKRAKKSKSKGKHKDETPEERRVRKERKRAKKQKKIEGRVDRGSQMSHGKVDQEKSIEELLRELEGDNGDEGRSRSRPPERDRSRSPARRRSRSPPPHDEPDGSRSHGRSAPVVRRDRPTSRSPGRTSERYRRSDAYGRDRSESGRH